jgi:hypothetical protein
MSDTGVPAPDDVVMSLVAARANVNDAWGTLDELRDFASSAERALQDAETEVARASLSPYPEPVGGYHTNGHAGQQMDVLRQRCALAGDLTAQIAERLDTARQHIDWGRARLERYDRGPDLSPDEAAAIPSLRTRLDALSGLVDLARPLAHAARTHMQEAAEAAGGLVTPAPDEHDRQAAVDRFYGSVHAAGHSLARADEASRHRSVGYADSVAEPAHQRLRNAQHGQQPSSTGQPTPMFGPAR